MTRFYLHIHDRNVVVRDHEGVECQRVEDARLRAFQIVTELIADGAWAPNSHGGRYVAVENAQGLLVQRVMLWEVVEHGNR